MITLTLIPRADKDRWVEVIEIHDGSNYPIALVHVDSFHNPKDTSIYEKLRNRETIKVALLYMAEQDSDQ